MRPLFALLLLSLCIALPATAHADTFQYTIVWDIPHVATNDTSEFLGTYTFTVDSLLNGDTFVYGPGFTDKPFPGHQYVYSTDLTVPTASKVDQIDISYFPNQNPYSPTGPQYFYGLTLYQAAGGAAVSTSFLPDPTNPNYFSAVYGDGSGDFASMLITDLSTAPVPEPSSITLLGLGALALGSIYRRTARTRNGAISTPQA